MFAECREAAQSQKVVFAVMLARASCQSYRDAAVLVAVPVVAEVAPFDADKGASCREQMLSMGGESLVGAVHMENASADTGTDSTSAEALVEYHKLSVHGRQSAESVSKRESSTVESGSLILADTAGVQWQPASPCFRRVLGYHVIQSPIVEVTQHEK